jgi:hypothetical protein
VKYSSAPVAQSDLEAMAADSLFFPMSPASGFQSIRVKVRHHLFNSSPHRKHTAQTSGDSSRLLHSHQNH